jgi:hypothetical protein
LNGRPERDRDDGEEVAVEPAAASAVLALQRSAGNAAVGGWLRNAPANLVQRERKLPDDPHSLADIGSVAKEILFEDVPVTIPERPWYFKNPRLPARKGVWVETRFGGQMAAKADKAEEEAVRAGLGSLGMIMFGLDGDRPKVKGEVDTGPVAPAGAKPKARRPPSGDITRLEDLDLTSFGGQDGRYRFTAVVRKGTPGAPVEVDLIVELLGARSAGFQSWDKIDPKRRGELEARFQRFGFVKKMPAEAAIDKPADTTMPWSDDSWGKVLQAIAKLPDEILGTVSGIAWERGRGAKSTKGESGHYDTKTGLKTGDKPERLLTIYDDAFRSDDILIRLVAHEVGHAVSHKPAERGGTRLAADAKDYGAAAKADGMAITQYGRTDMDENYAEAYSMFISEPATMKLLRPNTFAWFERQRDALKPPPKPPAARTTPVPAGAKR